MSAIKELEKKILNIYEKCGYSAEEVQLVPSSRPDLGEYQLNDAMKFAKVYHKSPIVIANEIVEKLTEDDSFTNINVAGAGFINISLTDKFLIGFLNNISENVKNNIDLLPKRKVMLDYGGANIAKSLHVGHLRPANIGEAVRRLASLLGLETISDVHWGDSGLQSGIVLMEMQESYPDLICFKEDYNGEDFDLPIANADLSIIYPRGSAKTKENEELLEIARDITLQIQKGHIGYNKLWEKISILSMTSIKEMYDLLNTNFDLLEGEIDSYKYIPELIQKLESKNLLYESEGAKVMDVKLDTDTLEMPPIIVEKSNGAYMYSTTDLATIYGRMKRFDPSEIWYFTDIRQQLHFTQVFRASKKSEIVKEDTVLEFCGNGTINGTDGKPFKTRAGGVMELAELINIVKTEILKRINHNIVSDDCIDKTANILAIGALKYADLSISRSSDYIFDPSKFSDFEGKTGPYITYSTIRIKSLLNKAAEEGITYNTYKEIKDNSDKEILLTLLELPNVLAKGLINKSLNEIADYTYKLTSTYNKFYSENRILIEENKDLQESWLVISKVVYDTNLMLLDVMGIECPEKM